MRNIFFGGEIINMNGGYVWLAELDGHDLSTNYIQTTPCHKIIWSSRCCFFSVHKNYIRLTLRPSHIVKLAIQTQGVCMAGTGTINTFAVQNVLDHLWWCGWTNTFEPRSLNIPKNERCISIENVLRRGFSKIEN